MSRNIAMAACILQVRQSAREWIFDPSTRRSVSMMLFGAGLDAQRDFAAAQSDIAKTWTLNILGATFM